MDKIYANAEIKAMITASGTGIHDEFDISKLRYDKIIIMTDASGRWSAYQYTVAYIYLSLSGRSL